MKAFVIRIDGVQDSEVERLANSIENTESDIDLTYFDAVVPDTIEESLSQRFEYFDKRNFKWNWPTHPSQDHLDMKTGLYKFCYGAADQNKKVACSLSHMLLWDKCVSLDEPIIIFEADALVTRKIEPRVFEGQRVVGLNDPRGATRRAQKFHDSMREGIQPTPVVNNAGENPLPQGLAGHSAYYIDPRGSKELLDKVSEYGMWPNDAYMCRELFPWIRVVYPYYTKVQGTVSTTTR